MSFFLAPLPPKAEIETKRVLKQAAVAHRWLAELKGICNSIPNQAILINTLSMQEAKDSSAIENIITTHDSLYKGALFPKAGGDPAAKEVSRYATALKKGYSQVLEHRLLTMNQVIEIHRVLEGHRSGIRKLPGTDLRNQETGALVYTPPQRHDEIVALLSNLERFINDEDFFEADLLVKMALIHYQFESIHPFYDGNGRTGRIVNVLYLVQKQLLNIPVLYLSRYIIQHKAEYYRLLQAVRDDDAWEEWVLYMLRAVEETAQDTIELVQGIQRAMQDYKRRIRSEFKFYSQDLINNLFSHPYTKIAFLMKDLQVGRLTATKYLDQLSEAGFLKKERVGKSNYYINQGLYLLLAGPHQR
ncbi:MAG: Fic family protein [bacterium]|nr:Fic family protein [bacterium]